VRRVGRDNGRGRVRRTTREVLDFDAEGKLVGMDIDHASRAVELGRFESVAMPSDTKYVRLNPFTDRLCSRGRSRARPSRTHLV
jgi:hypothetical protein